MSARAFFLALAWVALAPVLAPGLASAYEPPARTVDPDSLIGKPLPSIRVVDDSGASRSLGSFGGQPLILLPMYTNCQKACLGNVQELKRALGAIDWPQDKYRVLLFSFDAKETPASLRRYRERQDLPIAWSLATADSESILKLMDSIGFTFADANGQFMHPNRVAFLTSRLRIAGFVYGSRIPKNQLREGLLLAADSGHRDLLGAAAKYLLGVLIFLVTGLAVYLVSLVIELKRVKAEQARGLQNSSAGC